MHERNEEHSADESIIGYYYQAIYALYVLLNGSDDLLVSIETADDVTVTDKNAHSLLQLKYSGNEKSVVTIKNEGLWKTIKIWADFVSEDTTDDYSFIFVTTSNIDIESALSLLLDKKSDRSNLIKDLTAEADRVLSEREAAREKQLKLPHKSRYKGCEAFSKLVPTEKKKLIDSITMRPNEFKPQDSNDVISKSLILTPPKARSKICSRLIEWWDTQIFNSILNKRNRYITKLELQEKIAQLIQDSSEDKLFDDFGRKNPPSEFLEELKGQMVQQIRIVDGSYTEITRAARDNWRARNQRSRWIEDDISMSCELEAYDDVLIEAWDDHHSNVAEKSSDMDETQKKKAGHEILEWSYSNAHREIEPIRSTWDKPYLIRGIYQMLSDELKVGWHPDYLILLMQDQE